MILTLPFNSTLNSKHQGQFEVYALSVNPSGGVKARAARRSQVSTTTHSSSRINVNITSDPHQTEHSKSLVTMSSKSNITILNAHQRISSCTSIDPEVTVKANEWEKKTTAPRQRSRTGVNSNLTCWRSLHWSVNVKPSNWKKWHFNPVIILVLFKPMVQRTLNKKR